MLWADDSASFCRAVQQAADEAWARRVQAGQPDEQGACPSHEAELPDVTAEHLRPVEFSAVWGGSEGSPPSAVQLHAHMRLGFRADGHPSQRAAGFQQPRAAAAGHGLCPSVRGKDISNVNEVTRARLKSISSGSRI